MMDAKDILSKFNVDKTECIERIHEHAWDIDCKYVLKNSSDLGALQRSVSLSELLLKEGVLVAEYLKSSDGQAIVQAESGFYVLMKKLKGSHPDPFVGNLYENGVMLGENVARLHVALAKIDEHGVHDNDCMKELDEYSLKHMKEHGIQIFEEIVGYCYGFEDLYKSLPRQIIHRDIHTDNVLFEKGKFSGFLDFDMSQRNVRIFDVCYLGATLLVENYQNEERFEMWRKIFRGVFDGYCKAPVPMVSKLTENEIRAIPYMFIFIELVLTAFFAGSGNMDVAESCADMVKWLYENRNRVII